VTRTFLSSGSDNDGGAKILIREGEKRGSMGFAALVL
jgi:hypothetical protein